MQLLNQEKFAPIERLPTELLEMIASHLGGMDIISFSGASKTLANTTAQACKHMQLVYKAWLKLPAQKLREGERPDGLQLPQLVEFARCLAEYGGINLLMTDFRLDLNKIAKSGRTRKSQATARYMELVTPSRRKHWACIADTLISGLRRGDPGALAPIIISALPNLTRLTLCVSILRRLCFQTWVKRRLRARTQAERDGLDLPSVKTLLLTLPMEVVQTPVRLMRSRRHAEAMTWCVPVAVLLPFRNLTDLRSDTAIVFTYQYNDSLSLAQTPFVVNTGRFRPAYGQLGVQDISSLPRPTQMVLLKGLSRSAHELLLARDSRSRELRSFNYVQPQAFFGPPPVPAMVLIHEILTGLLPCYNSLETLSIYGVELGGSWQQTYLTVNDLLGVKLLNLRRFPRLRHFNLGLLLRLVDQMPDQIFIRDRMPASIETLELSVSYQTPTSILMFEYFLRFLLGNLRTADFPSLHTVLVTVQGRYADKAAHVFCRDGFLAALARIGVSAQRVCPDVFVAHRKSGVGVVYSGFSTLEFYILPL